MVLAHARDIARCMLAYAKCKTLTWTVDTWVTSSRNGWACVISYWDISPLYKHLGKDNWVCPKKISYVLFGLWDTHKWTHIALVTRGTGRDTWDTCPPLPGLTGNQPSE